MKLSFAIPKDLDAMSLSEFEQFVIELSAMGYEAVEPLINEPTQVDVVGIKQILHAHQMKISGLRSGSIYGKNGWCLSSTDKDNRAKAVQRLKEVIILASAFCTNVMVGLMQGHLTEGQTLDDAEENIVQALRECSDFAQPYGVTILYEAVNRFELEYHNTTEDMIRMLERINVGRSHPVKLLPDVYHMHLEDPSIPSALIRSMPYMGHVHFSDSNRCSPGSGCIDFVEVVKDLHAMDYSGYVAIEVKPIPSILESAQQSISYLRPIINAVTKENAFRVSEPLNR